MPHPSEDTICLVSQGSQYRNSLLAAVQNFCPGTRNRKVDEHGEIYEEY